LAAADRPDSAGLFAWKTGLETVFFDTDET